MCELEVAAKCRTAWNWFQGFHWDKFVLCLIMHMVIPLAPLIIEYVVKNANVSTVSLLISTSMYCLSLGSSSKKTSVFALSLAISLILAALYGTVVLVEGSNTTNIINKSYIYFVLSVFFILHIIERFKRHAVDQEPFWNFS